MTEQITYGDVAQTSTVFQYDVRRRLASVMTHRGPPALWSETPPAYSPAPNPGVGPSVFQTVLENASFTYDVVDNPIAITDGRSPSEWPTSFKPSTRQLQYDDLYRLKRIDYLSGDDDWTSPYAAENADPTGRAEPSPHVSFTKRVRHQTFAYDALGNTATTDDDAHGFYDRSLGAITNGTAAAGPYQLKQAAQSTGGARDGSLSAAYDDAGQLTSLAVQRSGPCLPASAVCSQRFAYEWDEVGHLARARRWDLPSPGAATDPLPGGTPDAELRYTYAGDERVLKTAVDASENELHTVYIFGSLELRRAAFEDGEYERTSATMAPYVSASGTRLARLYYSEEDIPTLTSGHLHVLLELADHLGSSSFVIDKATSELVEATRYEAYGATESDYRPDRWKAYREDHRFTGKEEDIEVGLTYFGARYYSPALNRWTSADPLAVHVPGAADLNLYAYVHGQVLRLVVPLGLEAAASGATTVTATKVQEHTATTFTELTSEHSAPTPSPDAPAAAAPPAGAPATPPSAPGIAWWEHVVLTSMLLVHGALGGGEAAAPTNENYTPPKRADAVDQALNVVALHITVRGAAKGLPILSRAAFDQLKRIANSGVRAAAKQAVKQEARAATSTAPSAAAANEFPALGELAGDGGRGAAVRVNAAKGAAFEERVGTELAKSADVVAPQVTVKTASGTRTRIDFVTKDASGTISCIECKSSATARLTENQARAFPEIAKSGATVVGKGKPGIPGGTKIPATQVQIRRPSDVH
ncbi:MAG: RHS repeat-associated core domain-containing protein [Labilithrix sp.]|nr:RHS repeat-associated core domain-containing protein [Labilithrix sp.]